MSDLVFVREGGVIRHALGYNEDRNLTAASGQVAASSQVSASGQFAALCSCRVLSHQTLLWHHQLGHPSLPRLCSMHSRLLLSGLPRSLPPLPRSPSPPCLPCVEGRQRAAPPSSSFPQTTAPMQTLHMDVWGSALVCGTDHKRYFLLVVDDYMRYTTVFPLRSKADVRGVLIPWIHATGRQLRERFQRDLPVLRLHSDRGASLEQNGIAERRIGLIMEVARTSMIHAAAPHFLWPFAVRHAAHQLNLWPRGALSLVRDTTASKLSPRTLRCAFLGFPTDASLSTPSGLVTESESVCPLSVKGELALGSDLLRTSSLSLSVLRPLYLVSQPCCFALRETRMHLTSLPCVLTLRRSRLRRPPGFTGSFLAGTQRSLWRPVYGLRQAPREWHDTLRTTLAALVFAPSSSDPSLFLRTDTTLLPFYVLVYVDDLVFATADTEALALVKAELQERHTCSDLGELRSYLGLQITRDRARRAITLTQSHMLHQVLQRFGFQYSSPQPTPLSTGHSLLAPPSDESVEPIGPYLELVGCLMYLMTCTRSDLAYPRSLLARYVARGRHRKVHWDTAKRVLLYLCSTSGMGLILGGQGAVVLIGHSDASWAEDQATQRPSQGYTFSLGSGSVSWRFTRSSSVLGSSCEAEIYAGAMAAQELLWLTYLLTDLGERSRSPPVLYVDNKAMLALCHKQRLEHKTKHIALRYFLARELQHHGQLRLSYVASRANTADVW
ncbi:unnamed protein product [Closterium sp. NIES-53]